MDNPTRRASHLKDLEVLGNHWQRYLTEGYGPWKGDPDLVLARHRLTDEIEVWYQPGDVTPRRIFNVPADRFDIGQLLLSLWKADNTNVSVEEKLDEVDAANAAVEAEAGRVAEDHKAHVIEKLQWAVKKDLAI